MGAHSAGRRVVAPGRNTRLSRATGAVFLAALVAAAAFAGWVSFEAPPRGLRLNDPPVAALTPETEKPRQSREGTAGRNATTVAPGPDTSRADTANVDTTRTRNVDTAKDGAVDTRGGDTAACPGS